MKSIDHRLAGGAGGGHQACGDLGRGRLGDDHDHARGGVAAEQVERLEGGDGAHRFGQVAAAGAEGVGDAAAELVNAGGDELEAGARGADHADGAAAHGVGKAEADAVDDGRAAVGAHHEQAACGGGALEGDLVFEAHVVAVEKDVAAEVETLAGDAGGKAAGHGDEQPAGVGGHVGGGLEAARAKVGRVACLAGEQGVHLGQGGVGGGGHRRRARR